MKPNAYHFTASTLRDGSPIPPIGETLVFTGTLELCASGYHASRRPLDALQYAPGNLLHLVHCGGKVINSNDKLVCSERTIIATINAEDMLRRFAIKCAQDVLHMWDAPEVVVQYLKAGDASDQDAARAASGAARAAAWAAAGAAACAARAARAAAWAAARAAAWDARAAARDAAWAAAWDAAGAAAWAASGAAARAARAAQNRRLVAMIAAEQKRKA